MIDTIFKRRSIRKFTDEKIKDEDIKTLLQCAMAAPSARNMKPWDFYVIKNKEIQAKLKNVSKNFDFNSSLIIIVCGNTSKSITKNDNDFWIQDCSAAIENMMLAGTSLNIGSVWCGIYPVAERVNEIKKILQMNDEIIPLGMIHFGYKAEEKEARTQYDESCVHYVE